VRYPTLAQIAATPEVCRMRIRQPRLTGDPIADSRRLAENARKRLWYWQRRLNGGWHKPQVRAMRAAVGIGEIGPQIACKSVLTY
jgi:hypothetical protein